MMDNGENVAAAQRQHSAREGNSFSFGRVLPVGWKQERKLYQITATMGVTQGARLGASQNIGHGFSPGQEFLRVTF